MNMIKFAHVRTPFIRFVLSVIASMVLITSTPVQAVSAQDIVPPAQVVPTTVSVPATIQVPQVVTPAPVKPIPVKVKKVWNTVASADLETKPDHSSEEAARTMVVPTTAYTSDPGETDASPFTTADGSRVRDGIIAANFLKIGTRVRIPEYFGDKVFEVHDRMNARYDQRVDIWMTKKADAYAWGVRRVKIEILP